MHGRKQIIRTGPTRHVVRVTQPVRSASLVSGTTATQHRTAVPVGAKASPAPAAPTPVQPAPAHDPAVLEAIDATLSAIESAVQQTELRRQESLDELRLVTIEMSVAIASRIVGDSAQSAAGIEELVNEAITRFGGSDEITIALNPADMAELNRVLGDDHRRGLNRVRQDLSPIATSREVAVK